MQPRGLPGWADDGAATARSRARIAPRRCPLSMSDMRASRCVLKSGYNYIPLFLKLITRSSRHYSKGRAFETRRAHEPAHPSTPHRTQVSGREDRHLRLLNFQLHLPISTRGARGKIRNGLLTQARQLGLLLGHDSSRLIQLALNALCPVDGVRGSI
eukprot:scaffold19403_cov168-Isochrysis_galbana.AAC.2